MKNQAITLLSKLNFNLVFVTALAIVGGLLLRAYQPLNTPFAFDQVQIAQAADEIRAGDLTFIGPRTGPAAMFTGPLIYYVAAGFAMILLTPQAVVAAALFFALLTGAFIGWLSTIYLGKKTGLIFTVLWAFSPFIIGLYKIAWNPNIMILAAALIFLPLLRESRLNWKDSLFILGGAFLGYQAHFSGFLLIPLLVLSLLIRYLWRVDSLLRICLNVVIAGVGLVTSMLPTLLFDYRNDWLNARGFLSLLQNRDQVSDYQIVSRMIEKLLIVLETAGKIVLGSTPGFALLVVVGLSLIGLFVLQSIKNIPLSSIPHFLKLSHDLTIGVSAIQTLNSVCPKSFSPCSSMYLRIAFSFAPTVVTKYPSDQTESLPQYTFLIKMRMFA